MKALSGNAVPIRACQPKRRPPMGLRRKLILKILDDRYFVLIFRQRLKAFWKRVTSPSLIRLWKPSLLSHTPPHRKEYHSLGRLDDLRGLSEFGEAYGFECRKRHKRCRTSEK